LMLLPESVLLGLFPQGLVLSKPASWEGADDGVFTVDVGLVWSGAIPLYHDVYTCALDLD
jgi:hypothetical protein